MVVYRVAIQSFASSTIPNKVQHIFLDLVFVHLLVLEPMHGLQSQFSVNVLNENKAKREPSEGC